MNWWQNFRRRGGRESELQRELGFHVEERVADLVKTGLSEDAARRKVRHEFGGIDQVREECRDVRRGRCFERLVMDLTHSIRRMRKRPVLPLTIILTVAVCVAVNTAVFTVVDSLLIRSLPFPRADRLVAMSNQYPKAGVFDQDAAAPGDYFDRQGTIPAIAEQALYQFVAFPFDRAGQVIQLRGMMASPSLFRVLRAQPAEGRFFAEGESAPGKGNVVIVTDGLRREMFGGGDAVGKDLRIGNVLYRVIGVLPAGFRFISPDVRYFVPLTLAANFRGGRHANNFRYIARLADGATLLQARAQVRALNARVLEETPAIKKIVMDAGFYTHVEEPWVLAASAVLIGLIALSVIAFPAFRAARVDPIQVLRDN